MPELQAIIDEAKKSLRETDDPGKAIKLGIAIALLEAVQAQDDEKIDVIMRSDIVLSLKYP